MTTAAPAEPAAPSQASRLLAQLRANPKLPLIAGAAFAVALVTALTLWSRAPDYKVLYGNVSDRDGGAMIAALQQMNVPYRFADGGTALLVPADKVAEVRLRLAGQGLPKGGTAGFELMDNQKFGTSQFAEQVNYQRALEGELARSIGTIGAVESARVHLALPKPSLFVRDQKKPSASVVLALHPGRVIDEGQVNAIVHMVSSSVPELATSAVNVVDQRGNLLTAPAVGRGGLDGSQLKYAQEIEQTYVRRIEAILQPILGAGNVHAQVAADIDFSVVEATDEKFMPNQAPGSAAIRSQQSSESVQQNGVAAAGVPGALSNQPPATPVAPIALPAASQPAGAPAQSAEMAALSARGGNARRDATTNYELDRSVRHVQHKPGAVRRVSVAVVVNHRAVTNAKGERTVQALSATELDQVRNLVKEAMGYSADRGDSLNVVSSPFATDPPPPELPLWQQPAVIAEAKELGVYVLLGLLALFLWFALVRPLLRKHLTPPPPVVEEPPEPATEALEPVDIEAIERQAARHTDNLQYARELAEKEPLMVASLLKNWMTQHEGR